MRKIRLKLDALQVQSFSTGGTLVPRGTVRGAQDEDDSGNIYCISVEECVNTRWNTCGESCEGTCAPEGSLCA